MCVRERERERERESERERVRENEMEEGKRVKGIGTVSIQWAFQEATYNVVLRFYCDMNDTVIIKYVWWLNHNIIMHFDFASTQI